MAIFNSSPAPLKISIAVAWYKQNWGSDSLKGTKEYTGFSGIAVGGEGTTPYPPGEGRKIYENGEIKAFFKIFFAYLIQNGLNDTKMEFFRCRVIR